MWSKITSTKDESKKILPFAISNVEHSLDLSKGKLSLKLAICDVFTFFGENEQTILNKSNVV